jgi:hypothetical protein
LFIWFLFPPISLLKSPIVSLNLKHIKLEQQNPDTQVKEKKRPTAITVICVISFIGSSFVIPLIFSEKAGQIGSWNPPYLGFSFILGFVCMIGLWQMKKWAANSYTVLFVINQIVLLIMGIWSVMALIIPAIVVGIVFKHIEKMN